jgi:hypothetical protein
MTKPTYTHDDFESGLCEVLMTKPTYTHDDFESDLCEVLAAWAGDGNSFYVKCVAFCFVWGPDALLKRIAHPPSVCEESGCKR